MSFSSNVFLACDPSHLGIECAVLVNHFVPGILCKHLETFGFEEVEVAVDWPASVGEHLEETFASGAKHHGGGHFFKVTKAAIDKEEFNVLRVVISNVGGN